jgi:hypothetical protein
MRSHISDSYDGKPWFAKVNELVTNDLRDRLDWVGIPFVNTDSSANVKDVRQLDYACGTGQLSRVRPHTSAYHHMTDNPRSSLRTSLSHAAWTSRQTW